MYLRDLHRKIFFSARLINIHAHRLCIKISPAAQPQYLAASPKKIRNAPRSPPHLVVDHNFWGKRGIGVSPMSPLAMRNRKYPRLFSHRVWVQFPPITIF
jgi:hypothetical protein